MKEVTVAILVILSLNLFAQSEQDRFKKIFDEELADESGLERTSHSARYQHASAQKVPAWFINPPVSDGNAIYAIGISDPAMDTTEALDMALERAQIMANILRKSTTQLLCDFFLNEESNSNSIMYEHYSRISAKLPIIENTFELVESYRNNYEETMVLIKYNPPKRVSREHLLSIGFELYKNETSSETYGLFESVYEMKVVSNDPNKSIHTFYELTELGQRTSVVSQIEDEQITVPIYTLAYMGIPSSDSVKQCYFTHGLWKDYFKSVMVHIIQKSREKPENISFLSDKYQVENYQKLTRGVSVNKMRFVINGFSYENGKLKAKMTELDL